MANKRITDVDFIESLNSNESFFVNQNNAIKQVDRANIVWDVSNGGTGATDSATALANLGAAASSHTHEPDDLPIVPVTKGGTGASDAATALVNLGAQAKHIATTVTLSASGWSSLKQTVSVSGVTANNAVITAPAPSSRENYCSAGVYCSAQASGKLTFTCDVVPSAALTVNVIILN